MARDLPDPGVAENKYTDPKQIKSFVNILISKSLRLSPFSILGWLIWLTEITAFAQGCWIYYYFLLTGMTYNLALDF